MSTRLILLSESGNFIEWGPGCALAVAKAIRGDEGDSVFAVSLGARLDLGEFADIKQAEAVRALWLAAILGATDGGLLRWDEETGQVVDEMAEADCFAEMVLRDFADRPIGEKPAPQINQAPAVVGCSHRMMLDGGVYPRHCRVCALGPCRDAEAKAAFEVAYSFRTDADGLERLRKAK